MLNLQKKKNDAEVPFLLSLFSLQILNQMQQILVIILIK